jgi:predicted flap endonuclease-1-like 5' DNA nuclease
MPNQQPPERTGTPPHDGGGERALPENDEVYELQDHEFILEVDDTLEFPNGSAPPGPLPPWAAASRALLDDWLEPLAGDPLRTVEVTLGPLPRLPPVDPEPAQEDLRGQLARVTRQMDARQVYYQELERALVVARGRMRGQTFRLAELELELRETRDMLDELRARARAKNETASVPAEDRAERSEHPQLRAAASPTVEATNGEAWHDERSAAEASAAPEANGDARAERRNGSSIAPERAPIAIGQNGSETSAPVGLNAKRDVRDDDPTQTFVANESATLRRPHMHAGDAGHVMNEAPTSEQHAIPIPQADAHVMNEAPTSEQHAIPIPQANAHVMNDIPTSEHVESKASASSPADEPTSLADDSLDITVTELSPADHADVEQALASADAYGYEAVELSPPPVHGETAFDLAPAQSDDDALVLGARTGEDHAPPPDREITGVHPKPNARKPAVRRARTRTTALNTSKPRIAAAPNASKPRASAEQIAELCQVRGIGPRLAERLLKHGITLGVLAAAASGELTQIAERIAVNPARIKREGWSKQARALRRPQRLEKKRG